MKLPKLKQIHNLKLLLKKLQKYLAKRKRLKIGLIALSISLSAFGIFLIFSSQTKAAWFNPHWQYRLKLTFDNSSQSSDLDNFPVMVKLTSSNFTFDHARPNGEDLRFTDSNGRKRLSHEIESYDSSTDTATIWVNVPKINGSSATDFIYMYYGNPSAHDVQDTDGTWNSNYKGVYHLSENTASTEVKDSSGNANTITASGNTTSYNATGQISSGYQTMGTPQHLPNEDGTNQAELYPSIQLDSNSYPVVAYHDNTGNNLNLIHCNDKECKGDDESVEAVISAGNTGDYPSLQLDSSGYPMISFFDEDADDLYYVHCDDANCEGSESAVVLDTTGAVGKYSSMVLDSAGFPVIAYRDDTNDALKLIHCDDADCSSYSTNTVDASANMAYFHSLSLKLDSSDFPVIAYYDHTARSVKLTHCNDADCAGSNETTNTVIDEGTDQYRYINLQLDTTNQYPMIVYFDETNDDLFYVHCDDVNCAGTETPVTLNTGAWRYPWMQLNSSGNPLIVANNSGYIRLFSCSDADCSSDTEADFAKYTQYGLYYPEMVLDENDYPVVVGYSRGQTNDYDIDILRFSPKLNQSYDSDFDFGTSDFSASVWFKSDGARSAKENYLISRYDNDQGFKVWLDYAGHACFGIDDDASFGPDDQACTTSSNVETNVDNGLAGNPDFMSMKLDSSGYPVIAYFDNSSDNLELVHCNDANCAGGDENTASIDTSGDVGRSPSLVLDSSGYPVISYHDNTNQDLKVVHCGDANCSSGNTINTIDSTGNVGDYSAIALDGSGYPYISYYDATNTAIKLIHCNDANCSGGDESIVTVDNTEYDRPYTTSTWMKLNGSGFPIMAYFNDSSDDLKLARCTDANCTSPTLTTVETSGTIGRYASLELDGSDYPVIATSRSAQDLKLIHCSDVDCTSTTSNYVKDQNTDGEDGYYYIDLELNSSGNPVILSYSLAEWSHVLTVCNDANCAGDNETFSYIQGNNYAYLYSSLELDGSDYPVIAFSTNDDLHLLHTTSATSYTDTGSYNDNQWHHLVAVKDDTSSIKVYIDGSEVATDTSLAASSTLTSDSAELRLAETITQADSVDYSNYNWSGFIDEVQIDSTARSADWVAAQYLSETDAFITYGSAETSTSGGPPVLYLKFDEGFGTTANDSSPKGNDGTISNATWTSEDQCISGNCLEHDGSSAYTEVADDNSLDPTTALTVSAWIKPTDLASSTNYNIVAKQDWGNKLGFRFALAGYGDCDGNNCLFLGVGDGGTQTETTNSGINLNQTGQWYHVTATFDSGDIKLYVNGAERYTTSTSVTSISPNDGSPLRVGRHSNGNEYFPGFIDEVKLYPYARSAAQIKADYVSQGGDHGASATYANQDPKTSLSHGLVGYWKMDEATANTCTGSVNDSCDSSGNSNDGAWQDNATSAAGKFGNSVTLDGTTDQIDISNNIDYSGTDNLTISAWVYPTESTSARQSIVSSKENQSAGPVLALGDGGTNTVRLYVNNGSWASADGTTSLGINQWHHVTGTYDGNTLNVFVNGVLEGSTSSSGSISSTTGPTSIGGRNAGSTNYFQGKIDEARIYNRALTPREIRALYNHAPGPVGHWKMDEGTGTTSINDSSGNGNTGTMNGTMTETDWVQGKYGKALDFDGDDDTITAVDSTSLDLNQNMTLSAWIKTTGSDDYSGIIKKVSGNDGYQMGLGTGGNVRTDIYNGSTYVSLITTGLNVEDGAWHHLSATYDGSNYKFYVDGVLEKSSTGNTGFVTTNDASLIIGDDSCCANREFDGQIDDVRIYNYARTPGQIVEDMNAGHPIGGSPIGSQIAYYKLDKGYGTTAYDQLGNNNGTLTNSPTWTNDGKHNKALNFNSFDTEYVDLPDNIVDIREDFSVSMWVKPDAASEKSNPRFIGLVGTDKFQICYQGRDKVNVRLSDSSDVQQANKITSNGFGNDSWLHIVTTVDSSNNITIYVNGVEETTTNGSIGGVPDSRIGHGITSTDYGTQGIIDEVKIYNSVLTQDQVLLDYNQGAAAVLGAVSTDSSGNASFSSDRSYCPPGDATANCAPVAEWKFDEHAGSSAFDTSGNGSTATLTNTTWTRGKHGGGLDYDGSNSTASLSDNSNISLTTVGTLEAWIRPDREYPSDSGSTVYRNILSKWTNGSCSGSNEGYAFDWYGTNSAGTLRGLICNGTNSDSATYSTTFTPNQWYHAVFTWDATNMYLYIDGVEVVKTTQDYNNQDDDSTLWIGDGFGGGSSYRWDGDLDNIKIYDYALSQAQIAWNYNRGAPVGHWKLDDCTGDTAYDASDNGIDGTITIGATGDNTSAGTCSSGTDTEAWNNGTTGKLNYSMDFDGTDDYIATADHASLDVDTTTLSAWIKTSNTGTQYISERNNATYYFATLSQKLCLYLNSVGAAWDCSDTSVTDGNWHHVAVTWDGSDKKFYIDGKLDKTVAGSGGNISASSVGINIGYRNTGGTPSGYFNGQIDDFRMYNYAMTLQQIQSLYNNSSPLQFGPTTGHP